MTDEQRKHKNECARENRQWKKERHLCVRCGKQDAYTLNGRSQCYECCEYDRNRKRYIYKVAADDINMKQREKYHKNVESGICPTCNKKKRRMGI